MYYAAKFNCTVPGTLYKYSIDCPAPQTCTVTTTMNSSDTETDGQKPIKISGEKPTLFSLSSCNYKYACIYIVAVGAGSGIFAVLVLSSLCTCAVIFSKRRIKGRLVYNSFLHIYFSCLTALNKVSAIRSRILERNTSTTSKKSDAAKNEKGTD